MSGQDLDNTWDMAVTYATDTPDVEAPEREWDFTAQSDAFDAIVGGLEAYSQEPRVAAAEDGFEEPFDVTDKRALVLAAVFLVVETVLILETVLVIFVVQPDPGDGVGLVISALLGVALFANFVAAIAAAWAAAADRRWQASVPPSDDWIPIDD